MKPNRVLTIATLAALVLPALVLSPVEAQRVGEAPPQVDPVFYSDVETNAVLFLRDIADNALSQTSSLRGLTPAEPPDFRTPPPAPSGASAPPKAETDPRPRQLTTAVKPSDAAGDTGETFIARFSFDPNPSGVNGTGLRHGVTIRGANAVNVLLYVQAPPRLEYTVSLYDKFGAGKELVAEGKLQETNPGVGNLDERTISIALALTQGRTAYTFDSRDKPSIEITARSPDLSALPVNAGSWTLIYDERDHASRVDLVATNALKVATWTQTRVSQATDEAKVLSLFRNYTGRSDFANRVEQNRFLHQIEGRYVVRSAFGLADVRNMAPTGEILGPDKQPVKINPWSPYNGACAGRAAVESIPMVLVSANEDEGTRTFRFQRSTDTGAPACLFYDYWLLNRTADGKAAGGSYVLRAKALYRPSTAAGKDTLAAWPFQVSAINVQLRTFSHDGAAEVTSHPLVRGTATQFLLDLRNGGAANDTIKLTVSLVSQSVPGNAGEFSVDSVVPMFGDVQQPGVNQFRLGPGNRTVIAVSIRAPNVAGASATYKVEAESQTDPQADSAKQSVVLTAGPTATDATSLATAVPLSQALHQPRIIVQKAEEIVPGFTPRTYSAFVWNRYVLPQDIAVGLVRSNHTGWSVNLLANGRSTPSLTMTQLPPGGVTGLNYLVTPARGAADTEDVELRATLIGAGTIEVDKETIRFLSRPLEAFEVKILGDAGTAQHFAEVTDPSGTLAGNDALDGSWYRVWITNNAGSQRTFRVSATLTEDPAPTQAEAQAAPNAFQTGNAFIGHRDFAGKFTPDSDQSINIQSAETGEMYVFVKHSRNINDRPNLNDADVTIRVADTAPGGETRSRTVRFNTASPDARTGTDPRIQNVLLEPVVRSAGYNIDRPIIDISQINTRTTQATVPIGDFVVHRFRVTNAASWWMFEDPITQGLFWSSQVNITVAGADIDTGWNAYFRLAKSEAGARPLLPASCSDPKLQNSAEWTKSGSSAVWPPVRRTTAGAIDTAEPLMVPNGDLPAGFGREGFMDAELEVLVCAPPANFPVKPLAGQFDQVVVTARQVGPRTLESTVQREIKTIVQGKPNIIVTPRVVDGKVTAPVFPSQQEAIIPVFLANNGSYLTNVSLEARFKGGNSNGWTITGLSAINITPLRAFENRTIAFHVFPPTATGGNAPGPAVIEIIAKYRDNLYDESSLLKTVEPIPEVRVESTNKAQKISLKFGGAVAPCAGTQTALTCTAQLPTDPADPMPTINIPVEIKNEESSALTIELSVPTMPGWTFTPGDKASYRRTILVPAGATVTEPILVRPPREVVTGSFADIVVAAREVQSSGAVAQDHGSVRVARVVIQGGLSLVNLDLTRGQQFVERNLTTSFQVAVRNDGNVDGEFRLQGRVVSLERAQGTTDPRLCPLGQPQCWTARLDDTNVEDDCRDTNTAADLYVVFLRRNQLCYVNLTIKAPFFEQENAFATGRITVWNATNLLQELGRIDVKAEVQDYGVTITQELPALTLVPGLAGSLLVSIKNTGDANDTVNLSLDTGGLPWRAQFSSSEVRLSSGSSTGVRLTIQTPIDPLPAPRTVKFWVFLGTRGGQAANVSVYSYQPMFITIPDYRQLDVDGDNITELAVDLNRDKSDGYEVFQEYSSLVRVSKLVDKALGKDKHFKLLLDRPTASNTYDGVADRFWDPDSNLVTDVKKVFDVDKDQTPDYLLDTDGDDVVDSTFQAATRQFLKTDRVKLLGNDAGFQFLIDSNGDGKPDKYYDPVKNVITKLVPAKDIGTNVYGVDTDDDGRVDLYYDYLAKTVTPATGVKIVDFARQYWWVFAGFVGTLVLFGVVLMRRRAA